MNGFVTCSIVSASCSRAVLAGQEGGPQMEQSSFTHPGNLEEVEGEILFSWSLFTALQTLVHLQQCAQSLLNKQINIHGVMDNI